MLENLELESQAVLESLKSMVMDIPWPRLREFIKYKAPLRREFQKGGTSFKPKNIYLGFKSFLDSESEGIEEEKDIVFDELFALLPEGPANYFLYFSSITFSEAQGIDLHELSNEITPHRVEILRKTIFEKNKRIQKLDSEIMQFAGQKDVKFQENIDKQELKKCKQKLAKDIKELEWKLKRAEHEEKQLHQKISNEEKKSKELEQQIELLIISSKNREREIEALKMQNQQLAIKEKELNDIKERGLQAFLESRKDEIENRLAGIRTQLEEENKELEKISSRANEERRHLESLEELGEQKRKELMAYVEKGEKWRHALYPEIPESGFQPVKNETFVFSRSNEQKEIINEFSELERLLDDSTDSSDEMSLIRHTCRQLDTERLFPVEDMKEISQIENFFKHLGHENGRFVLNVDASWLTPASLWGSKGYLKGFSQPVSLTDVVQFAGKEPDMLFQVEILGADRAPVEGYLGPLIKALTKNEKIVISDRLLEIPRNLLFFLQFDKDEYCANLSNWSKKILHPIKVPSLDSISKKIFVSAEILFRGII